MANDDLDESMNKLSLKEGFDESEPSTLPSDDISIKKHVKYRAYVVDWKNEKLVDRVSIAVHLPSGTRKDDIGFKVSKCGTFLSFYEKYNTLFSNAEFLLDAYPGSDQNHPRNVAFDEMLREERQDMENGLCDHIQALQTINLPFACAEKPIEFKFGDEVTDVDLRKFKSLDPSIGIHEDPNYYLIAFYELEALIKHKTRMSGFVSP